LAAEVEKELKELAEQEKQEAEAAKEAETTTTTTTTDAQPEAVLENVDQSLFTGEDLPEDFSDEDEGK
jgi:hypothetical protein